MNAGTDDIGSDVGNGRCETAPGNNICTLPRAMEEARRLFQGSFPQAVTIVIDVPDGIVTLSAGLRSNFNILGTGELEIIGAGASTTRIDASLPTGEGSLFNLGTPQPAVGLRARLSGLTIRGAYTAIGSTLSHLTLDDVRIEDSRSEGVVVRGDNPNATLTDCVFSGNQRGALWLAPTTGGTIRVSRTVFRGNSAPTGAAISIFSGTLALDGVTLVDNHVTGSGGAVAVGRAVVVSIVNSTFSGNRASDSGGAIFARDGGFGPEIPGTLALAHSTFVGNEADADHNGLGIGAAIASAPQVSGVPRPISLDHVVFSQNMKTVFSGTGWSAVPGSCDGSLTATGPARFDVLDCSVSGVPPAIGPAGLGPLLDNGGPTPTHAPLAGSALIDGGLAAPCRDAAGSPLTRDQRGRARLAGAACDLGAVESGAALVPKGRPYDVNGDGRSDLLWRRSFSVGAEHAAWLMNGAAIDSYGLLQPIDDPSWKPIGSDDFDGDGKADIVWRRDSDGLVGIWSMDGLTLRESRALLPIPGRGWRLAATGDLDGDDRADLVWEFVEGQGAGVPSGLAVVWLMNGPYLKGFRRLPLSRGWGVAGVGDADGNGSSDLLLRHTFTGTNLLWFVSGLTVTSAALLPTVNEPGWTIAGFKDLDGNGAADVVWRNADGANAAWLLANGTITAAGHLPWVLGQNWTLAQILDTDGDGRADLIWREAFCQNSLLNCQTARWRMDGLTIQAVEMLTPALGIWQIR
ncbi:MAG: FG-GAP-like repeat-containing protein [Phycisphaerales bacterium]